MFHIYGLAVFATGILAAGSTVIVLSKFDMGEMLSTIVKYRATYLPLVPPILVALINGADQLREWYDLSSLKFVISGGAPLSKEVIEGFSEKYPGATILQAYGLTESAGVVASMDTLEESRRYGTAGLLSPNTEAKIVDPESGKALLVNQTGELWLRAPSVMKESFCSGLKRPLRRGRIARFPFLGLFLRPALLGRLFPHGLLARKLGVCLSLSKSSLGSVIVGL
ncbi:hypothetical protein OIU77_020279 [Salix suchowensis]|uniref:AMP-dependent synthetase/ligase domain-containing protein n=1 Tax=Salix suchowensis TaxID=1278906 RepID=A0ABQ9CJ06_9ROSI|nr:hypothetical protein OIU77_020279 [Salix suchowensis]